MNELFTEIEFENCGNFLTVTCPDEENEMNIIVGDSHIMDNVSFSLTIENAEELCDFLISHIKNYYDSI